MRKTIFTVIVTLFVTIFTAAIYTATTAVEQDNILFLDIVETLYEGDKVAQIISLCALDDYAETYPTERGRVDRVYCKYLRDVSTMRDTTHNLSRSIEARLCRELLFGHPRYKHQVYNLSGVDFIGCDLSGFDFSGCYLAGAGFHRTQLVGCSFAGVDLTGADFYMANCQAADFTGAITTCADMRMKAETIHVRIGDTMCCEVAITNSEACCPVCGREVIGADAGTDHERGRVRWRDATSHWMRNK